MERRRRDLARSAERRRRDSPRPEGRRPRQDLPGSPRPGADAILAGVSNLRTALALVGLGVSACSGPNPPPRWVEGGAPLVVKSARWQRADDDPIEILPNGQVVEDGDPILLVDPAGRVVDDSNDPVAILLPDGRVAGNDSRYMGHVGIANAAPPWSASAWLSILPNGQVLTYDEEGEQEPDGAWEGCNGPQLRTCALVTHMLLMRKWQSQPRSGVSVGVGIGIGVGR